MYYTIYKITNRINGKYYIGKHQTKNLNDNYFGSGKLIQAAIKKYGIDNFTKDILFIFDNEDDMNKKEKEIVVISEQTYNLCEGGQGGFSYINKNGLAFGGNHREASLKGSRKGSKIFKEKYNNDPEFREKMLKYRKIGSEIGIRRYKEKYPNGYRGWKQSKEALENQRKSFVQINHQQGSKNSQYGTCWITNGQENKKIKKEELDIWLEKGYTKGRKMKV